MTCPDCPETMLDLGEGAILCPACDSEWVTKCQGCGEAMHADDAVESDGCMGDWHPSCLSEDRQLAADVAYEAMISRTY